MKKGVIIGIIIGILASGIVAYAAINASEVEYKDGKKVDEALNDLYGKVNGPQLIDGGIGSVVYLDPTDLSKTCNNSNSVSTTGTKTGCMKWYIYDNDGDKYKLILDHNTTAVVDYSLIDTTLINDTKTWNENLKVRLILIDEIATITRNTWFKGDTASSANWWFFDSNAQNQVATISNKSKYTWLFDYTKGCTANGCNIDDSSTFGYFTSGGKLVWGVNYWGAVDCNSSYLNNSGIRPVIEISKDRVK